MRGRHDIRQRYDDAHHRPRRRVFHTTTTANGGDGVDAPLRTSSPPTVCTWCCTRRFNHALHEHAPLNVHDHSVKSSCPYTIRRLVYVRAALSLLQKKHCRRVARAQHNTNIESEWRRRHNRERDVYSCVRVKRSL